MLENLLPNTYEPRVFKVSNIEWERKYLNLFLANASKRLVEQEVGQK